MGTDYASPREKWIRKVLGCVGNSWIFSFLETRRKLDEEYYNAILGSSPETVDSVFDMTRPRKRTDYPIFG